MGLNHIFYCLLFFKDSDGEDSVNSGTETKAATPEPPATPLSQEELVRFK